VFSARKSLIKAAEACALVCIGACLFAVVSVARGALSPPQVQPFVLPGFVVAFLLFAVGYALVAEFKKLQGKPTALGANIALSFSDMKSLVRWCPKPLLLSYALALLVTAYAVIAVGIGVSWRSGEQFTEKHSLGFPLFVAVFLLTLLPVIASASRMPGTYAEHFHPRLTRSAEHDA
jgi:hypothetical protein